MGLHRNFWFYFKSREDISMWMLMETDEAKAKKNSDKSQFEPK